MKAASTRRRALPRRAWVLAAARVVAGVFAIGFVASPASAQSLRLLNPSEASSRTTRDVVHVLGRTEPGNTARIGGEAVEVYTTGVFVRDRVPLQPGRNEIDIEVRTPSGERRLQRLTIEREAPPTPPPAVTDRLAIDGASLRPSQLRQVHEAEPVEVGFDGTPGMQAQGRWGDGPWFDLVETSPGRYRAQLLLRDAFDRSEQPVQLKLTGRAGTPLAAQPTAEARSPGAVGLWRSEGLRLYTTGAGGAESTDLVHGLHDVRLGGPNLAELPPGVLLRATGRAGDRLRVHLAPGVEAWAPVSALALAAPGTTLPQGAAYSIAVSGQAEGDQVDIAWPTALPYAARSVTGADGRHHVELDLFGGHHATTWISHKASARWVREVTAEQQGPGVVRLRIALHQPRLWGWSVRRVGGLLRLVVHAPPSVQPATPLAGLRVALEAGHGGPTNLGAVGPTGTPEKDINRWTTDALRAELEAAGAQVVDVRVGDENPTQRERARRVLAGGAQLFVSVHANAAPVDNGYLRAQGAGTFYKHPHSREAAAAVHRRLLNLDLPDLGLVSNFNYAPTRLVSQMPALLVEQAFVSNPREEAMLLDPAFRARLARAVREGLEDFLRQWPAAPAPSAAR